MIQTEEKIMSLSDLKRQVKEWQNNGEKIVFTNGCFDIVHLGHIDYLQKARNLGDRLIIGVNSDASVRKLKGETRPVVNEKARLRMMAALAFSDGVVLFDDDTPLSLIKTICPDILVKGDDYNINNIVGADFVLDNGGSVETIALVQGYSTTSLIEKIKEIE